MKTKRSTQNRRRILITLLISIVIGFSVAPSYSISGSEPLKVHTINMPGATGAANNVVYATDRYMFFAPFYPDVEPGDPDDLRQYNNNRVYVIDTKKPEAEPKPAELGNCYFPAKMLYDPHYANIFVRGTEYNEVEPGSYRPSEVIAHFHVNSGTDGEPGISFDRTVRIPVRIPIEESENLYDGDVPVDMALGYEGKILCYTSGYSIFTYNVIKGDSYELVNSDDPKNKITFLSIEPETNTLIVALSKEKSDKDGKIKRILSELWFYSLNADGTIDLLKKVASDAFPNGAGLTPGSNAAVSVATRPGTDLPEAEYGFFVTSEGLLCQVDLRGPGTDGVVEVLGVFPELAQDDPANASPRIIEFDQSRRILSVVKRGHTLRIRRPTFAREGRPGKIRRPTFARIEEPPVLVLAQLNNKKSKVIRYKVFADELANAGGLSELIEEKESSWFISTYKGDLFSVDASEGIDKADLKALGRIGSRVDHLTYNSARSNFIAVNSLEMNIDEQQMTGPGSLTIAKMQSGEAKAASLSAVRSQPTERQPTERSVEKRSPSVRRPSF